MLTAVRSRSFCTFPRASNGWPRLNVPDSDPGFQYWAERGPGACWYSCGCTRHALILAGKMDAMHVTRPPLPDMRKRLDIGKFPESNRQAECGQIDSGS